MLEIRSYGTMPFMASLFPRYIIPLISCALDGVLEATAYDVEEYNMLLSNENEDNRLQTHYLVIDMVSRSFAVLHRLQFCEMRPSRRDLENGNVPREISSHVYYQQHGLEGIKPRT